MSLIKHKSIFERKEFKVSKHYIDGLFEENKIKYNVQEIDDLNHFLAYNLIVSIFNPDDLENLEKRYCQISRHWQDDVISIWCCVIPDELILDANHIPESGS